MVILVSNSYAAQIKEKLGIMIAIMIVMGDNAEKFNS